MEELEEGALGVREGILALLECSSEEESSSSLFGETCLEKRQEHLCRSLLQSLQSLNSKDENVASVESSSGGGRSQFIRTSISDYNNKSEQPSTDGASESTIGSIRELLGNLPSATTTKLAPVLSSFLTNRVDASDLLPATQDDRANEEAMGKAAITLTKLSLVAAQLYVALIGMPGAWGAGMIDVGAISSLSALMRRWCLECRGREPKEGKNREEEEGSKRKSSKTKRAPPVKRSRKKNPRRKVVFQDDSDDTSIESSDDEHEELEEDVFATIEYDRDDSPLSTDELIMGGLCIGLALGAVPCQKDFMNWSGEAREALLDSIVTSLATTSALVSGGIRTQKPKLENEVVSMGQSVEFSLSTSLQKWVLTCTSNEGDPDHDERRAHIRKQHETSVFLLRGLLPVISMQTELPHGQRGKEAANDVAVSTLEGFIQSVVSESSKWSTVPPYHDTPSSTSTTRTPMSTNSNLNQGSYGDISTPMTGNKERKKRVSFGNSGDEGVVPPTLKKSCTPRRSRLSVGNYTPTQKEGEPRPILSAVVGMFQKLTTARGLEKANVRARMIATLHRCLPHLPHLERSHFLRFLIQLCHSKVSVHRLLGAELIGNVISETWLWSDHASRQTSSPPKVLWSASKTPSRRASLSPLVESSLENMPFALVGALHGRLTDKVPAVRARSAFSLADTFRKFSGGEVDMKAGDDSWSAFEQAITAVSTDMHICLRKRAACDERATVRKAAISGLVELLVLGETVVFADNNGLCISETDVSILSRLCADQSVSTRKAAADALTILLQKCYYAGHCSIEAAIVLEHAWASTVLPLVLDVESSCVGKAVDLFSSVVIDPLVEVGGRVVEWDTEAQKRRYMTAWRILAHASENSRQQGAARGEAGSLRAVLKKRLTESGSDEKGLVRSLLKEIRRVAVHTLEDEGDLEDSEKCLFQDDIEAQRIGAWCLLDAFVDFQSSDLPLLARVIKKSSIDMRFLSTSWDAMLQLSLSPTTPTHCVSSLQESMRSCLRVLSQLSLLLHENDAEVSSERLKELIGSFGLVPDLVGSAISALVALTQKTCSGTAQTKKECLLWIRELYGKCQDEITSYVSKAQYGAREPIDENEESLVRALFTVGELSTVGFRADEDSRALNEDSKTNDVDGRNSVTGLHEPPPKKLLFLVQAMLAKHLPTSEVANVESYLTPQAARAHAFTALGKLCLRDETLAKGSLTIFARELHQDTTEMCPSVQSNALLVLSDLCVKYTNLVDRYLPVMAACLQSGYSVRHSSTEVADSHVAGAALVRRHAVLILSSLLLQDYLKWRGLLFHRFLVASADEDEGVAKLAEMTLCGPLLQKHPKLFFNNFVEALFVLNRCTAHPIYTAAAMTGDNGGGVAVGFDGICFSGPSGRARRLQMYEMMLSNMTDEEKIGVTARLAKDVLGGALESDGDLSRVCRHPPRFLSPSNERRKGARSGEDNEESALNVLSDAFAILTSPNIRVARISNYDDDIQDAVQPKSTQLVVAAKDRLLSKISRKHLIEIVLPILCNLKTILQESCSPLLKELMRYLVEIFRAYKAEVKEFLANDPTLLQEVEYDAAQFKKSQKLHTPSRQEQQREGETIVVQ